MSAIPPHQKVFHITHVKNLSKIVAAGCLWSDAEVAKQMVGVNAVGMSRIKERRLKVNRVTCGPRGYVGDYVPFYFCPRSIMLYILHRGNHVDIDFTGGQGPIVHLQADLEECVSWADANGGWAASLSNAGALYTEYFAEPEGFQRINWRAVASRDFRSPAIKEGKQAEFLIHRRFPWNLVEHIGVFDEDCKSQVENTLTPGEHAPTVRVENGWYF